MKRSKLAFSLAEMLIVVTMVSCIAIAASTFVIKKNKNQTIKQIRGRYECFDDNGTIRQRYTINGKVSGETTGACNFNAAIPGNADFVAFTAVGGGGGGAWAPVPNTYVVQGNSDPNKAGIEAQLNKPDWVGEVEAKVLTGGTKVESWSHKLTYTRLTEGRGGGAGEARTVYLVRPGFKTCTAAIGLGGAAGTSNSASGFGDSTTITCTDSNGANKTVLRAAGGTGTSEYTVSPLLMDGMDSFDNGNDPKKPGGEGGASSIMVDDAAATKKPVNFVYDYGYGGKGAGSTIKTRSAAQTRSYKPEKGSNTPYNIPNTGKNSGANTTIAPQKGKGGAFIVTW